MEQRGAGGQVQRYISVKLTAGADVDCMAATIRAEPLFLDEETLVFSVESAAV